MPYLTLFGWSFLAATIIPIGSEPALIVFVRQGLPVVSLVLVATAGNYLGACTTYGLARGAARALRGEPPAAATPSRAMRLLTRYGRPALLLSWLPVIGDAIVAAAGVARVPLAEFTVWTLAGKLARYAAVAWGASAW